MGATIACAMDLFENGILTVKDTGGIALNFGAVETMVDMVRKTGLREGFGDKLALGSYRLAESFGHPEYSMTVKKAGNACLRSTRRAGHRSELRHQ